MSLTEAASRLRVLAEAHARKGVTETPSGGYDVSALEMDAVTFAAAFLSVFTEALEDVTA